MICGAVNPKNLVYDTVWGNLCKGLRPVFVRYPACQGEPEIFFFLFYVLKGILKMLASFDDCALFTDLGFFS